ncbi:SEC23-interacting protein isoform X2 [Harpegnathos saltator]|uniref:SEC23-interacting protein isoform X2 n=1 Tax=Harpegnathos saltator TaxID=610380 RepID=UPI000590AE07|nr:SEC23-interacting protein isoform X2 [Harpegnathos saltator]
MNNTSRKVKNPLLSAAGPGFPIENYTENALLVPVTPATPAVLRDDTELDNFVGQESVNNNNQPQISSRTYEHLSTNASPQPSESKDTANQPTKQGYFTSILSSLPNLSLASNKNDFPGTQISQTTENIGGATHESNPYASSQGRHIFQPDEPGSLATNLSNTSSTDLSVTFDPALPGPPQSTIPPGLPVTKDSPVSYRLGNQRRLKYALPPDLTSSNARRYLSPEIETFISKQNVCTAPPSILNPYESEGSPQSKNISVQQIGTPPEQPPTSEQLSRNSSLHGSFRSSPIASGPAYNLPLTSASQNPFNENFSVPASPQFTSSPARPIPSRLLEPATPQNTPANVSFPSFVPYLNRDFPSADPNKEVTAFKSSHQLNSPPEFSKDGVSEATVEAADKSSSTLGDTDATFTPISAAQVTEKLEHLLAEREESLTREVSSGASSEIDEVTSNVAVELARSFELQSEAPQAANEFIERSYEPKSNDTREKNVHSASNSLSDVFLGQNSSELSVTRPEVYTADNNSVVADIPGVKQSNAHSSEQPPTALYPIFQQTNEPSDQKSSLNYVPFVRPLHQNIFYVPLKPTEPSASVYFESTAKSTDRLPDPSSQGENWNRPVAQSTIDATDNRQQVQQTPAFDSSAVDSSAFAPLWNADQVPSQSQGLNAAAQSANQSTSIASKQPPPFTFYNPAEFAVNQLPQQPIFSYTPDQHLAQQQPSQSAPLYQSASGFHQQPSAVHENNTAYPLSVVSMATVPEPTGSATLSPVQMSTNSLNNRSVQDTIPPSFQNLASGSAEQRVQYRPMYHHWFYRKQVESKIVWYPFSMQDSLKLEEVHNSSEITTETTVATDGGRYDVSILRRQRAPVYWSGKSDEVRRCSWFYMGPIESKYVPYDEKTATKLEEEYKLACITNVWNRRIELNNGEYILFHSATVQVHYVHPSSSELSGSWGNSTGIANRPKTVKRGVSEFNIDEGEPEKVDHLLFLVHGIGSVCDLKFRTVEEVVDEFRSISLQLVQSHYRTASTQGIVNRIEVLPISWHATLHSGDTGIDKKLQAITLESIPKLRHFTNDTLLDILFYTSPVYCQTIMQTVGSEMNRLHALFKERNPTFDGGIYIGGHSLGSLILFDLLCHQKPIVEKTEEEDNEDDGSDKVENESEKTVKPMKQAPTPVLKRRLSKRVSYVMGVAGTGQPYIHYPQLNFYPHAFFALGSPIGMFVTIRGIDTLGENFVFPTCPAFFNIFHPFDPVAYRVESLINPESYKYRPMLIPHHKGRKRMHLELKETMARVGADLKQKLLDSVKNTWNSIFQLSMFYKTDNQALANEIDKVVEEQLQQSQNEIEQRSSDDGGANIVMGKLNGGRRIDYVLQEAPFEYINEYIFALTSHICYWESEDTMLLILKEMYGAMGIQTDAQLPQQTMSVERMSPSPSMSLAALSPSGSNVGTPSLVMGIDPTVPISNKPVGPPPKAGFVNRKS